MKKLGTSRSICPVCFKALDAEYIKDSQDVRLFRSCPEHGDFSEIIWSGSPLFEEWKRPGEKTKPDYNETEYKDGCPNDCGRCPKHKQHSCTVLFEITQHCNLKCPVCFASSGEANGHLAADMNEEPADKRFTPLAEFKEELRWIKKHAGKIVLQISGGEPTLYPQLTKLVDFAAKLFPAVQLNSNGLLLSSDPDLAFKLADAGLSWVFLQFDGTDDAVYQKLRGRDLWDIKQRAVQNCLKARLPVILVPTLARGVNENSLGDILDFALKNSPGVRGIHIQPMSFMGRNHLAKSSARLTLPEVLRKLCEQSKGRIKINHATAPACEHERCSFHCRYHINDKKELSHIAEAACCTASANADSEKIKLANKTVKSAAKKVSIGGEIPMPKNCCPNPNSDAVELGTKGAARAVSSLIRSWGALDNSPEFKGNDAFSKFIRQARQKSFSVTCMAFQDAGTLDLKRLQQCCVHVFDKSKRLIPFCSYNLSSLDGKNLYRKN